MAFFVFLRHPVTTLVTDSSNSDNLKNNVKVCIIPKTNYDNLQKLERKFKI